MQVWVYEEADESGEPNLYVHHDVMLPAFPLSLAWIDCSPSDPSLPANLAAVRLSSCLSPPETSQNAPDKCLWLFWLPQGKERSEE